MHIIAGLGNPGRTHANYRHNVGFMAADRIARRHSFAPWSSKFSAEIAEGGLGGDRVLLVKPQTYMNLSGEAIGKVLRFYRLGPDDLTVIYDEIDLAPGRVRVKTGGGAGGHNGIRSIDAHCGAEYHRVRIGIGHPGDKTRVTSHVLGDFAKADREWLDPLLDAIAEHAGLLVTREHANFMNRIGMARPASEQQAPGAGKAKGQSHIRQARERKPAIAPPETGPMAAILKKLFGKE
jgi:PTH1 family peptidyl-tRNA hydrolase